MFYSAPSPQWWGTHMEAVPLRTGRGLPWSLRPTESVHVGDQRTIIDHKGIGYGAVNTAAIVAQNGPGATQPPTWTRASSTAGRTGSCRRTPN